MEPNFASTYSPPLPWFMLPVLLRQLRTVIRSPTSESDATAVYSLLYAQFNWLPSWAVVVLIHRFLRSAAALSGHVSSYMLDVLHWLPLQQRISFRIIALIWRPLLGLAPAYLWDFCCTTLSVMGRRSLSSVEQNLSSLLPAQELSRIAISQWLAPRSGIGYLFHCA